MNNEPKAPPKPPRTPPKATVSKTKPGTSSKATTKLWRESNQKVTKYRLQATDVPRKPVTAPLISLLANKPPRKPASSMVCHNPESSSNAAETRVTTRAAQRLRLLSDELNHASPLFLLSRSKCHLALCVHSGFVWSAWESHWFVLPV